MVKVKMGTGRPPADSSSDGEDEVDIGVEGGASEVINPDEVDDSICIICNSTTYIGETISCETCYLWFHFQCVGVTHNDDCVKREDVPFFCAKCRKKTAAKNKAANKAKKKKVTTAVKEKVKTVSQQSTKLKLEIPPPAHLVLSTPDKIDQPTSSVTPGAVSEKRKRKSNPKYADGATLSPAITSPPASKGLKLKISFKTPNSKTVSSTVSETKSAPVVVASSVPFAPPQPEVAPPTAEAISGLSSDAEFRENALSDNNKKRKRRRSEDEKTLEEKWLDAVETGNLPAVDEELKSIKDPKLMTARQRAMIERQRTGEELSFEESGHMALDYGFKKKEENEETLKQKAIKSKKRKEIEMEKREQDKKKTMDRLLKKKDSKVAKYNKTPRSARLFPKISYHIDADGATISVPENFSFPLEKQGPVAPPVVVKCCVDNCENPKKYNCSKSGRPLCSLQCYKLNLQTIKTESMISVY